MLLHLGGGRGGIMVNMSIVTFYIDILVLRPRKKQVKCVEQETKGPMTTEVSP